METVNIHVDATISDEIFNNFKETMRDFEGVEYIGDTPDRDKINKYLVSISFKGDIKPILMEAVSILEDNMLKIVIPNDQGDIVIEGPVTEDSLSKAIKTN